MQINHLAREVSPALLCGCGLPYAYTYSLVRAICRQCDRLDFIYDVTLRGEYTAAITVLDTDNHVQARVVEF